MLPVCLIEDLLSTKQSYSHLAGKEDDFYSLIFERENCSQRISDDGNSIQHLTFFVLKGYPVLPSPGESSTPEKQIAAWCCR